MSVLVQSKQAFRFTRQVKQEDLAKDQALAIDKRQLTVDVPVGRTTALPDWVKDDWLFQKAKEEELLIEIVPKAPPTVAAPQGTKIGPPKE